MNFVGLSFSAKHFTVGFCYFMAVLMLGIFISKDLELVLRPEVGDGSFVIVVPIFMLMIRYGLAHPLRGVTNFERKININQDYTDYFISISYYLNVAVRKILCKIIQIILLTLSIIVFVITIVNQFIIEINIFNLVWSVLAIGSAYIINRFAIPALFELDKGDGKINEKE